MSSTGFIPRFDRTRFEWAAALRAAIVTGTPLVVLLLMGRLDLGIYASFSAFTGLYGRSEPYRARAVTLAIAGFVLVLSVTGGTLTQALGAPLWLLATGFVAVVIVGVLLTAVLQWVPRGPIFFVFAFLGTSMRPLGESTIGEAVAVSVIVASFGWLVGMSGWVLRRIPAVRVRSRPLRFVPPRRLRAAWTRENLLLITVTVLAGVGVYAIAGLTDVSSHHHWAVVTVVAVLSSIPALVSFDRLAHRVVGTFIGVGIAAAVYGGMPNPLVVVVVIIVCSFVTELVIAQHYGWGLTTITPLAIGATNLGLTTEWEVLFVDRARETLLGGVVCLIVIVAFRSWYRRRGYELPA